MKSIMKMVLWVGCLSLTDPAQGTWVQIYDGDTHIIDYAIDSNVEISLGSLVSLVDGGSIQGHLRVYTNAETFTMSGGIIYGDLFATSWNPIVITGGHIMGDLVCDATGEEGVVNIFGTDFEFDGAVAPYGAYWDSGHLTGILMNGDSIDVNIENFGSNYSVNLMPVPEPASIMILASGLFYLRRMNRQNF